ncbi:MAG TPA: hypothetical protein VHS74_18700 [Solirubrobacterales bacterium]|jgi:hypothetical protein|nr:hypothetical protein [Solirubrobacterales bacterium]
MLAARNRYFRVAAASAGAALLFLAAFAVIEVIELSGETVRGGYTAGAAIFAAAYLVGACGWFVLAAAFEREIDWRRLRLGATVVAASYVLTVPGWIERMIAVFADYQDGDYHRYYVAGVIGTVVFAVGACVAAAGLGEGRRGAPRASRLWLGAILLLVASLAVTISQLYLHSFYSANHAVHEATIGTLVAAVGVFLTAVAGVVFVRGAKRPFAGREAGVAAAGAVAILATVLIGAGEALLALAYSRHGGGWQATVSWLAVASRLFFVAGFVALTLGAREARGGSALDAGGAA